MTEDSGIGAGDIGTRIRTHREGLKMTQADLSLSSGIGASSLSDFENGKRDPTLSQLKRLATCLGTDVAGLLSAARPSARAVRWRERPANAERIENRFLTLCRWYRDLERWVGDQRSVQLRRAERFPDSGREAEALARQVAGEMRLGDRPGLALRRRLDEDYGLKVFHLKLDTTGTAACTGDSSYGPAVLLNSLNSPARRTFDLAHELFHLLTWHISAAPETKEEESLADRFAAALLLPEDALREAVDRRVTDQRLSIVSICELARDFSVSVDALLWRVHNVYRLSDPDHTRALIGRARDFLIAYREFKLEDNDEVTELPDRYRSLAIQALRSGEISTGRFAEYMGLRRWQAMKYAEGAVGDDAISMPAL